MRACKQKNNLLDLAGAGSQLTASPALWTI
jgi:hypothetical protein